MKQLKDLELLGWFFTLFRSSCVKPQLRVEPVDIFKVRSEQEPISVLKSKLLENSTKCYCARYLISPTNIMITPYSYRNSKSFLYGRTIRTIRLSREKFTSNLSLNYVFSLEIKVTITNLKPIMNCFACFEEESYELM